MTRVMPPQAVAYAVSWLPKNEKASRLGRRVLCGNLVLVQSLVVIATMMLLPAAPLGATSP